METPSITWYNRTTEITAGSPRVVLTSSTLTLQDIVREDQGDYTCTATFPEGITQATTMLFVNGKEVTTIFNTYDIIDVSSPSTSSLCGAYYFLDNH